MRVDEKPINMRRKRRLREFLPRGGVRYLVSLAFCVMAKLIARRRPAEMVAAIGLVVRPTRVECRLRGERRGEQNENKS